MGANAQTTVPSFTIGQVLTADQQNQSARTGVPVFATTVERDAAFGGSGEKTLAEGQLAYLEDSDIVQYYDGSGWATLAPQTPVASGLELISTTTIGSAVASVTVSGAFSATYDSYRIIISDGVSSGASITLLLTLGATTSGYYWAQNGRTYADADTSGASGGSSSSWRAGCGSTKTLTMNLDIVAPFLSTETNFSGQYQFVTTTGLIQNVAGFLDNTTSYTAFTLTPNAGTLTGGEIRVYGYKN